MRAAKWIANLLASQIVWVLISGSVGALGSAALKAADVLSNPYGLVAVGLFIAAICVALFQKFLERQIRPEIDRSSLWAMVYGEREKERERRAKQIAKEIVDREERG